MEQLRRHHTEHLPLKTRTIILAAALLMPGVAIADDTTGTAPDNPSIFGTTDWGRMYIMEPNTSIDLSRLVLVQATSGISTFVGPQGSSTAIAGCCTIHGDGKVDLAEGVKLDDASRAFWIAVSQFGMQNCRPIEGAKP
jgi:hypothetical protein